MKAKIIDAVYGRRPQRLTISPIHPSAQAPIAPTFSALACRSHGCYDWRMADVFAD